MEKPHYSTDPQEQEKDGNVFRKPFEALAGDTIEDDRKDEADDDAELPANEEEKDA